MRQRNNFRTAAGAKGGLFGLALAGLAMAMAARAGLPVEDGFETYAAGEAFGAPTNGWQAGGVVVVTNDAGHRRGAQSAALIDQARLTNEVAAGGAPSVWTEAWVEPFRGGPPLDAATNGLTQALYFDSNGYVVVATPAGWTTCSNDIWGGTVEAVTTSRFVHVALFQDYAVSNWALFVDGRLVLQDQRFTPRPEGYGRLVVRNTDGQAWLDDVWIKTNHNAGLLTNSYNHNPLADAAEVALYGYAARTLYVGDGPGVPHFASVQAAMDAWRPNDAVHVHGGLYVEDVVVTQDISFVGEAFTNGGTLAVAAGADVSFAQSATWGAAAVTGTVAVTGGGLTLQSDLTVGAGGWLSFSNAALSVPARGVTMTGAAFTVDAAWGSAATLPLPFQDDFELYAPGTRLQDLGFRGWGASETGVVVLAGQGYEASRGAVLPAGSLMSNRVDRGTATRLWTDVRLLLQPGDAPAAARTNDATFACYVDTNRQLVVNTPGGWRVCSNYWDGTGAAIDTGRFTRVTVHQDLALRATAVFLDGRLLCEALPFSGGAPGLYRSVRLENRAEAAACADEVAISTNLPFASGYPPTGGDLDGDGWLDAVEIDRCGNLTTLSGFEGTVFKFR